MESSTTNRQKSVLGRLRKDQSGQSLVEIAVMVPILALLMAYTVDYGYFFLAASYITSSARNAAQYSVLGYEGPAQSNVPVAGPASTVTSVTALALADLNSLVSSATTTTVEVCSKSVGTTGNLTKCTSYLNGSVVTNTYTPNTDPEAPRFYLHRVDVTYTVQPPVPMGIAGFSFMPSLQFHRSVSMRDMD